jgi:hypothetical protein
MLRALRLTGAFPLLAVAVLPLAAQDFVPPDRGGRPTTAAGAPAQSAESGLKIGVFGFSTRGGMQVNRGGQGVIGSTIDVVQLGTPLVRIRPSIEMGFGSSTKSVGVNVEAVYRFQPDQAPAIPYLGLGLGYYDDSSTTRVWPTVVMGFELAFRHNVNWLVEYHALDGLSRSRFFVGLATRGII